MKNLKTKLSVLGLIVLLLVAVWYFFLKRWDYKVIFTVPSHSSLAYDFIKNHHDWNGKTIKPESLHFIQEEPWGYLRSELNLKDTTYFFDWHLEQKNDSVTKISMGVSDKDRNLANRLDILFSHAKFKRSIKQNAIIIRDKITERNKEFRYVFAGLDSVVEVPCVVISSKTLVCNKADEMIRNVTMINLFVKDNELGLNGNPMVLVKSWTPWSDSIDFDFCFPILYPDLVPIHPEIKLKKVSCSLALHADFYGNYSYSNYSWNRLYEEAQKRGAATTGRIVEIFIMIRIQEAMTLNGKQGYTLS